MCLSPVALLLPLVRCVACEQKYEKKAASDKARYEKEKAAYEPKGDHKKKSKASSKSKSKKDDDDDEDDDNEDDDDDDDDDEDDD